MAWVKFQLKEDWKVTECEGISVVSAAWGPICLMAYGLSQMGARRMLYNIGGWHPLDHAVDIEIALRTQDGKLSGYTLTPPLFTYWRSGGSQDSDNDQELDGRPVNTEGPRSGASTGIKSSVRRYMQEYFAKNYWEDMKDQIRW
jgi:hypothetical protein